MPCDPRSKLITWIRGGLTKSLVCPLSLRQPTQGTRLRTASSPVLNDLIKLFGVVWGLGIQLQFVLTSFQQLIWVLGLGHTTQIRFGVRNAPNARADRTLCLALWRLHLTVRNTTAGGLQRLNGRSMWPLRRKKQPTCALGNAVSRPGSRPLASPCLSTRPWRRCAPQEAKAQRS